MSVPSKHPASIIPAPAAPGLRRVALAFPYGRAFVENVVEGIHQYARQHAHWQILRFPERLSPSLDWLQGWEADGAFVIISTREDARIARRLHFPVVNLTAYFDKPGVTTVTADHRAIGRLAAQHLIERRFRRFGYYGSKELYFSRLRRRGFHETVRANGGSCAVLEASPVVASGRAWARQQAELERWLRSLSPPVAIMASTDLRADILLTTCRRLGLRVPEDVAVIGVDNDPIIVAHSEPPLTSIARNDLLAGELAARALDGLMAGGANRREQILVPPAGVIARHSTETMAVEDAEVTALLQDVRSHIGEKFGVERMLERSGWSRRTLETRFRREVGAPPAALILRLRLEHAQRLLENRECGSLTEVAEASGFSDLRHFRLVFRRMFGVAPSDYRRGLTGR